MKAWQRVALAAALLAALGLAGCQSKASGNTQNNAQGNGWSGQGQAFQGTAGIVTDISDTSITVAVMPQGQGFGQGSPRGSGRPGGTGRPQGSARPDQGQPSGQANGGGFTPDTSSWEKKTYVIDSSTKITSLSRGNGNNNSAQSTTIKASDIKTGESVRITERSGQTGTADTISVMGAFGRGGSPNGGQNQGNQGGSAPSSTSQV